MFNLLYEHIRDEDGQFFTDKQVSEETGMSQSTISALRRNITSNPRLDNLKAIALFFDISLNYFAAKSLEEAINIIAMRRQDEPPNVELATRLTSLSEEARDDLERILKWVQKADTT